MKPPKAKGLKKVQPVKKSVNKKSGSKIPEKITLLPPQIDRKLTELLASSAAYGYWNGLFRHGNTEPVPTLNPDTEKWREEIQAAIHKGFEEGRKRRIGEENADGAPPKIEQT